MRICAFTHCTNSTYSLKQWKKTVCPEHLIKQSEYACPPPFVLYPFPTEEQCPETRKEWIKAVNRKDAKTKKNWQPSEDSRVCSVHFPEGKPTEAFPSPSINLSATGREKPLKRKRPPPKSRAPYQKTKKIANARIHVERAIGRMKNFAILKTVLPITLLPVADDIIVVCACICNLLPPLEF